MKALFSAYVPLSLLSALSILGAVLVDSPQTVGPVCVPPPTNEVASPLRAGDERVYYIGCGGLY